MTLLHAIGHVATAPVRLVKHTAQLLTLRSRAEAELELFEQAEATPQLYRDATWWSRVFTATRRLVDVLPIAPEVRSIMQSYILKAGIVLGTVSTIALTLHDQLLQNPMAAQVLQLLPPKYGVYILGGLALAGKASALFHESPTSSK